MSLEVQYENVLGQLRDCSQELSELRALNEFPGYTRLMELFEAQLEERRNHMELESPEQLMDLVKRETLRAEIATLRLVLEYLPNRMHELQELEEILKNQEQIFRDEMEGEGDASEE